MVPVASWRQRLIDSQADFLTRDQVSGHQVFADQFGGNVQGHRTASDRRRAINATVGRGRIGVYAEVATHLDPVLLRHRGTRIVGTAGSWLLRGVDQSLPYFRQMDRSYRGGTQSRSSYALG